MHGEIGAKDRLILALDPPREEVITMLKNQKPLAEIRSYVRNETLSILDEVAGEVGLIKVNYAYGMVPGLLSEIEARRLGRWLDGKYNDIPRTVEGWVLAAVMNKVNMITIHANGGLEMMEYAARMAKITKEVKSLRNITVLAISVLTSIGDDVLNKELEIPGKVAEKVTTFARLAEKADLDGIVASAAEAPILRKILKPKKLIVTPAIKPWWAKGEKDDQNIKRIDSPRGAILNGATHIVVGSGIIKAKSFGLTRVEAAQKIVIEIEKALDDLDEI